MRDDVTLLQGFVQRRSEGDFAELVRRHVGLVFATALRRVGGDTHLAQDVTQAVFVDLARRAPALLHMRVLAGWLYTSALYTSAKAARAEQRRHRRDQQTYAMQELHTDTAASDDDWNQVRPVLDDALRSLSAHDRDAVLLRFFHGQGFSAIGAALQISENGARMRVERALEKLRGQLARRGIASSLAALGTTLSAHAAVSTLPATLAATVTTSALAGAASTGATVALFNFLAMTKTQLGLAAAVATVAASTVALDLHEQNELRTTIAHASAVVDESAQLRTGIAQLQKVATDFEALASAANTDELAAIRRETAELRVRRAHLKPPAVSSSRATPSAGSDSDGTLPITPLDSLDAMPRLLQSVSPVYPYALSKAAIPGEVVLSFIIDTEGRVLDPVVVETTHPDFVAPALKAAGQWQFASGLKGGRSVNTRVKQVFRFEFENPNWF